MMKRIQISILTSAVFVLSTGLVFARTPVQPNAEMKENIEVKVQEKKDRVEEKIAEVKALHQEREDDRSEDRAVRRDQLAKAHAERLERRFAFYAKRLSSIAERLQSRLNTLKDEGKNISVPQKSLDTAKAELQKAQTAASNAVVLFTIIPTEEGVPQQTALTKAKEAATEARKSFIAAHKLLTQAVKEMRAL